MLIAAALSLAIWAYLLLAHGYFWQHGPFLPPKILASAAPPVAIIVPARDEAPTIARALKTLLAQDYPGDLRVILVDDGSTDGTGTIARALDDPRLTVLTGKPRPRGWSGKLWALAQGVQASKAELLLFTDADIEHAQGHLAALVAKLERDKLDLVSEMVALNCDSLAEQALVPAFVYFFALLYPFAQVNNPRSPTAAAAGGTVLIRRAALHRIGGLEAMCGALIDDVTLASMVKRGGGIYLGHSRFAASIRPYPHPMDVWRMIARTAYVQLEFSPLLLAFTVLGMLLVFMVPPAAALAGHGLARPAGLLAWAAMAVSFLPTLWRFRLSAAWAPLLPVAALFYTAATVGSAADHMRGRGVVWKRRSYS
jgi:hopene-associated glycosyltransferase HpnB